MFKMPCCCVRECKNRSEAKKKGIDGITFHLFPRNIARQQKWAIALKRINWKPSPTAVVCSKHFDEHCFYKTRNGLIRLQIDAIPKLHVPKGSDPNISSQDSKDESENTITNDYYEYFPVLKTPVLEEGDPPITKVLVSDIQRLQHMCKKQRKLIKKIRNMLKDQEKMLLRLTSDL